MSFFSFLMEYYIWIMVALVFLVIGVIGFLVDSKKKSAKDSATTSQSSQETVQPQSAVLNTNGVSNTEVGNSLNSAANVNATLGDVVNNVGANSVDTNSLQTPTVDAVPNVMGVPQVQMEQPMVNVAPEPQVQMEQPMVNVSPVPQVQMEQPMVNVAPEPQVQMEQPMVNVAPEPQVQMEQPMVNVAPEPQVQMEQPVQANQSSSVVTTNGSQPFDINSMFSNNQ